MKQLIFSFAAAAVLLLGACGKPGESAGVPESLRTFVQNANGQQAMDTLVTLLRENAGPAPELATMLGMVMEGKMQDTLAALSVYQAIVQAYPDNKFGKTASERIPKGTPALDERIEAMRSKMFDPLKMMADPAVVGTYLHSCMARVLLLPKDAKSASMLNKAAENAYYTQQYPKSLYLYEWLEAAYPDDDKAAQALFMRAFIYDNDLKQYDLAKPLYELFLQKYPKDDFADDAQVLLKNLGKSPEEMIQELQ